MSETSEDGSALDPAIAEIGAALRQPGAKVSLGITFGTRGAYKCAQVMVDRRKVGPLLLPKEGGTLGDLLRDLAGIADATEPTAKPGDRS